MEMCASLAGDGGVVAMDGDVVGVVVVVEDGDVSAGVAFVVDGSEPTLLLSDSRRRRMWLRRRRFLVLRILFASGVRLPARSSCSFCVETGGGAGMSEN